MSDIVGKLRLAAAHPYNQHGPQEFLTDAADEIERLNRELDDVWDALAIQREDNVSFGDAFKRQADEIKRLRALLEPFGKAADGFDGYNIKNPEEWFAYGGVQGSGETTGAITVGDLRRARAALAEGEAKPTTPRQAHECCGKVVWR